LRLLFVFVVLVPAEVRAAESIAPLVDPNYQALWNAQPAESFLVENLEFQRDAGVFVLKSGHISFTAPVLGRVTTAVFVGDGEFRLTPKDPLEVRNLLLFTEKKAVRERFSRAVFVFTDETYQQLSGEASAAQLDPKAAPALEDFRSRVRKRREEALSSFDGLLNGEDMDNVDADVLAGLYNPAQADAFSAYLFGREHGDLRFHVRPWGGLPQMDPYEEVALLNVAPKGKQEGIWYLGNLLSESPDPDEDKRLIDVTHYRIDTEIAGNEDLSAHCLIRFRPLVDGVRVLKFGLLPSLRVSRVRSGDDDVPFIQEPKKKDGSFYVVLPEAASRERDYELRVDYAGKKVIRSAGSGNFFILARTSWYPSVNAFTDRASFELSFRYPKKYELVSVGRRLEENTDGNIKVSHWSSKIPLAVAGFNYGRFKRKTQIDKEINYEIDGYAGAQLPDWLRSPSMGVSQLPGSSPAPVRIHSSPSKMMARTMEEARQSMRLFTAYFGAAPYGRIAITQQSQMFFGQSWPTLVYLPATAFLDSTQRWMLFSSSALKLQHFIQEVTPHEVSHQWWGHMVGWKSYHDQWISEGFADFSAALYVRSVNKSVDKFIQYIDRWRRSIVEKNRFGFAANDVGPIWMGQRLATPKTPRGYSSLVYSKGGYVLHMLRQMMTSSDEGDLPFRRMMQDFVQTYLGRNASTADFQRIVEKHMTPDMNLTRDGKMDWFFKEWVYGNEIPSYRFEYRLTPQEDGRVLLNATISQTGVSDDFRMLTPVYAQFGKKTVLLGRLLLAGNVTGQEVQVMLPQKPERVMINYVLDVLAKESESVATGG